MKRLTIFFAIIGMFLLTANVFPQSTVSETIEVNYYSHSVASTLVDSTDDAFSNWFSFRGYETTEPYVLQTDTSDALASTYYPDLRYITYKLTSATGKPRITLEVQGSNDITDTSMYITVDTLSAAADSSETWQYKESSFAGKRFLWYRYKLNAETGNRADTRAKIYLYYPKKKMY